MAARLFITSLLIACTLAHPRGAPTTACDSMYPIHKHATAQKSPCPYVSNPAQSEIFSNSSLSITLRPGHNDKEKQFKGYMIMACDQAKPDVAIGMFKVDSHSHTIDCHGGSQNTATHSSNSLKSEVRLIWIPPAEFEGNVIFKTTYVTSKKVFWVKEISNPVHVKFAPATAMTEDEEITIEIDVGENTDQETNDMVVVTVMDWSISHISLWALYAIVVIGFASIVLAKVAIYTRSKKHCDTYVILNAQ